VVLAGRASPHSHPGPDACEIGYTWLTRSAIRTAANSEAKLLMLTHAFETWQVSACVLSYGRAEPAVPHRAGTYRGKVLRGFCGLIGWPPTMFLGTLCAIRSWRQSGRR